MLMQHGRSKTLISNAYEKVAIKKITIRLILVFFLKNENSFSDKGFSGVSRGAIMNITIAEIVLQSNKTCKL